MLGFRNMQEKLEKTISINYPCFYRVNTNGQILFCLHCTVVKHHYLLKDTRSTLGTEHKRANLQILFYAFMSTYTKKTNTIQLLVLIVHSESSHEKFIKRYPQ